MNKLRQLIRCAITSSLMVFSVAAFSQAGLLTGGATELEPITPGIRQAASR